MNTPTAILIETVRAMEVTLQNASVSWMAIAMAMATTLATAKDTVTVEAMGILVMINSETATET